MIVRVLVAGSRKWSDADRVRTMIHDYAVDFKIANMIDARNKIPPFVIVRSDAPGAVNRVVSDIVRRGMFGAPDVTEEVFEADWLNDGKLAPGLSNERMVKAGADVAFIFIRNESHDALDVLNLVRAARIPARVFFEYDDETEASA